MRPAGTRYPLSYHLFAGLARVCWTLSRPTDALAQWASDAATRAAMRAHWRRAGRVLEVR